MLEEERGDAMLQIVLTGEQAKVVASALKPVQVRDTKDKVLGWITPIRTEQDVAKAKQILASGEAWFTTEQVLAKDANFGFIRMNLVSSRRVN
jgi:hypothetical protein